MVKTDNYLESPEPRRKTRKESQATQNKCGPQNSGAARELPRLGGHFDFFAFLNKEGNANFEACLQRGRLGHVAARRIAADARLGMGDRQLDMRRHLQADGVAVVFMQLDDEPLRNEVPGVADHLFDEGVTSETYLVHKEEFNLVLI